MREHPFGAGIGGFAAVLAASLMLATGAAAVTATAAGAAETVAAVPDASTSDPGGLTPLNEQPQGGGSAFSPLGDAPPASGNTKENNGASGTTPSPEQSGFAFPKFTVDVEIPTIDAVDANVDGATLKDFFTGKAPDKADAVAHLTATRITIPEIDVTVKYDTPNADEFKFGLRDIDVEAIADGTAQSVTIGGQGMQFANMVGHFGKVSAEHVNFQLLLAYLHMIPGDASAAPATVYDNLVYAGGSFSGPKVTCTLGPMAVATIKVRPLLHSPLEMQGLFASLAKNDSKPDIRTFGPLMRYEADAVRSIESSPMHLGAVDCEGEDQDSHPVKISSGGMTIGSFGGGRFPDFEIHDLAVSAGDSGTMSIGSFRLKSFDIAPFFENFAAIAERGEEHPTGADARALIPPFRGFAMSDFSFDFADTADSGQRIRGSLGDFDLSLGNYVAGIPSSISLRSQHNVGNLPKTSSEAAVQALIAAGIKSVDLSYDLAAHWDATSKEIEVTRFSVDAAGLGSIDATAEIGGATDDLFSSDSAAALAATMNLTLKRVDLKAHDTGLGDLLAKASAHGAGQGVADIRRAAAGMVQGALLIFLGGAADANEVSDAIGKFVNGAQSLSISAMANDFAGISFPALQALSDNPSDIGNQITIDATAR